MNNKEDWKIEFKEKFTVVRPFMEENLIMMDLGHSAINMAWEIEDFISSLLESSIQSERDSLKKKILEVLDA